MDDLATVAGQVTELAYALDTFYFLVCGAPGHVDGCRVHDAGSWPRSCKKHGRDPDQERRSVFNRLHHVHACAATPSCTRVRTFQSVAPSSSAGGLLGKGDNSGREDVLAGRRLLLEPVGLLLPGRIRRNCNVHCVRRRCRAHEALVVFRLCGCPDRVYLPDAGLLEMGRRLPRTKWVFSTSRARVSCIFAVRQPHLPACCCSAPARASTARTDRSTPFRVVTCRWQRSAP